MADGQGAGWDRGLLRHVLQASVLITRKRLQKLLPSRDFPFSHVLTREETACTSATDKIGPI